MDNRHLGGRQHGPLLTMEEVPSSRYGLGLAIPSSKTDDKHQNAASPAIQADLMHRMKTQQHLPLPDDDDSQAEVASINRARSNGRELCQVITLDADDEGTVAKPDIRIPSLVWNKPCQSTDGGEQVALCLILTKSKRGEKPVSGAKSPMNGIHHKRFKPPPQLRRIVVRVIIASRTGKDSVPVATLNYQIQTNFRDVCSRPLSLLDSTDAVF